MSDHTGIEWTDATWNPTTGCTKVSPACAHCYIERTPPFRIKGRTFVNGHIPLALHADRLETPLHWKKPKRIFVNSLSDLFHEDVPDAFIDRVFAVMALCRQHTFQVLTKRPERMRAYVTAEYLWQRIHEAVKQRMGFDHPKRPAINRADLPLLNVWLGTSVENQRFADERIPLLLQTPAAVRFISAEPLLGEVDLAKSNPLWAGVRLVDSERWTGTGGKLDWVIAGGESGPRFRYSRLEWVQSLRDQCVAAGVPFLFKQWGGPTAKSHGRLLDGREWNDFPEAQP